MATHKDYIKYLEDCLKHIPAIRFKPMFGEYALYCSDIVVGLVCLPADAVRQNDGRDEKTPGRPG